MSRSLKVFIILIVTLVLLLLYVLMSSEIVTVNEKKLREKSVEVAKEVKNQINRVNETKIKERYEKGAGLALGEFETLIKEIESSKVNLSLDSATKDEIGAATTSAEASGSEALTNKLAELKVSLMDLIVPEDYKELHLELIMSFTKIKEYLIEDSEESLEAGKKIISEAKEQYLWLIEM